MNRISSRLAAHTGTRQLDLLNQADAASDAVDRAIGRLWDRLMQTLAKPATFASRRQTARTLLHGIWLAARDTLHGSLTGLATQGYRSAADALVRTLPVEMLGRAANGRNRRGDPFRVADVFPVGVLGRQTLGEGLGLREDTPRDNRPGVVRLSITRRGTLSAADRARQLREPAFKRLTPDQQRAQFRELLFPPPSEQQVAAILHQPIAGRSWVQSLAGASKIAGFDPERMAGLIASGFALGKAPREIAKDLLPVVGNVKSSARRIARTYGMQVAHHASMAAHQEVDDLIVGYQIHAQFDQHTRKWHAARSGTIYYKKPGPGQKGLDQMPSPPLEAPDASERPAGTPHTAWNCRCFLVPVMTSVEAIATDPVFTTNRDQLIPDPSVYSDWFAAAPLSARKLAVGARRYSVATDLLGHQPPWEAFVEPSTGNLLSLDSLQGESAAARSERVAKVRAEIGQRRRDIGDVATFGFIPR